MTDDAADPSEPFDYGTWEPEPRKRRPSRRQRAAAWWRGQGKRRPFYVIVAVVAVLAAIGSTRPEPPASRYDAAAACERFVSRGLTAPATAKFRRPEGDQVSYAVNGDTYTVTASVDSQNGFGALVRTSYVCTVTYDRAAKEWTLNDLRV